MPGLCAAWRGTCRSGPRPPAHHRHANALSPHSALQVWGDGCSPPRARHNREAGPGTSLSQVVRARSECVALSLLWQCRPQAFSRLLDKRLVRQPRALGLGGVCMAYVWPRPHSCSISLPCVCVCAEGGPSYTSGGRATPGRPARNHHRSPAHISDNQSDEHAPPPSSLASVLLSEAPKGHQAIRTHGRERHWGETHLGTQEAQPLPPHPPHPTPAAAYEHLAASRPRRRSKAGAGAAG